MFELIKSLYFFLWRWFQALKGLNGRRLTSHDVPDADLTGKWIIISGANSGIGFEAAKHFARLGANLILACRDPPARELHPLAAVEECQSSATTAGHSSIIEWWEIEMSSIASVQSFAKRWLDTGRDLDVLCNNAGLSDSGPEDSVYTDDGFEIIYQVNFLSQVLLTLTLLPSIARSRQPRIVYTSSNLHFVGEFNLDRMNSPPKITDSKYSNNKLYLQMWLVELQSRLLETEKFKHITVNGVHPGYVHTGLWRGPSDTKYPLVFAFLQVLARYLAIDCQQGSLAIVNAVTNPKLGPGSHEQTVVADYGGGKYLNRIWEGERLPICNDEAARLALWNKVDQELQLGEKGVLDNFL